MNTIHCMDTTRVFLLLQYVVAYGICIRGTRRETRKRNVNKLRTPSSKKKDTVTECEYLYLYTQIDSLIRKVKELEMRKTMEDVKIMVKVVKSQPADHSTKGTESAVLTTDHVVSSYQFKSSSTKKYMRAYESST